MTATLPSDGKALRRLIEGSINTTAQKGIEPGGAITISRPSGKRDFVVIVSPVRRSNRYLHQVAAAAMICITDPDAQAPSSADTLRRLYRLTPVEARLVELLAGGSTVAELSDLLGMRAATARWHLKNVFAKTSTRTQSQLVRLVMAIPVRWRP